MRGKIFPGVPLLYMDCAGNEELAAMGLILPDSVALRRAWGLHRLLTIVGGGKHLVELALPVQSSQQGIGKQVGVGAIVLFNRGLEHVESSILLPAGGENRSLIVGQLRVGIRRLAGFRIVCHAVEFGGRPEPEAGFQKIAMVVRNGRHAFHSFARLRHLAFAARAGKA